MEPIQWLEINIPGFGQLKEEKRLSIQHFALLWSLFEGKVLGTKASAPKILSVVRNGFARHVMELTPYQKCFDYFRARYFSNGTLTDQFDQLRVSSAYLPLVKQVLREENNNPADIVAVILIVIYRFRKNLFHGVKWSMNCVGNWTTSIMRIKFSWPPMINCSTDNDTRSTDSACSLDETQ
jgi:hypothetical protein